RSCGSNYRRYLPRLHLSTGWYRCRHDDAHVRDHPVPIRSRSRDSRRACQGRGVRARALPWLGMRVPLVDLVAQFQPIKTEVMQAIEDCLDSMHLILGPNTQAFEEEFAAYCGARSCISIANGTHTLPPAL